MSTNHLQPSELYGALVKNGISYFCGVPDTLLSTFSFYLEGHSKENHDIAVNEGNAVALAIGHYLATKEVPLVYMQNSGIGNAINPLVSLADPFVMGVPLILLIGWRGQEGKADEPQHKKQGLVTTKLLEGLNIPYVILSNNTADATRQVAEAIKHTRRHKSPFALLVEPNTLPPTKKKDRLNNYLLSREEAIKIISSSMGEKDVIIATTGKASRELYEHRESTGQSHSQDLLVVGGMGHASAIALSIARHKPKRNVVCIDGDGALLMHMGVLASIGAQKQKNYYHFVINNGCHESVGGQPTVAFNIDIAALARACGYRQAFSALNALELKDTLDKIKALSGPILIEVRVNNNSRPDLTRPSISPAKNRQYFMDFLKDT
jgi:phosphonopyruvate decarboxylase